MADESFVTVERGLGPDGRVALVRFDRGDAINALSPAVYTGEKNTYGRAGHIPGSVNVFYDTLLDANDGTFLPPARLKPLFEAVGAYAKPRVICYCGGGISATMDALALTLTGHRDIAVYDGSMWEWVADPALPLKLGAEA